MEYSVNNIPFYMKDSVSADFECETEIITAVDGDVWDKSYVEIEGDEESEFALNYSIYNLNCIAPRTVKNKSIAARGLSGKVYKGTYFAWESQEGGFEGCSDYNVVGVFTKQPPFFIIKICIL